MRRPFLLLVLLGVIAAIALVFVLPGEDAARPVPPTPASAPVQEKSPPRRSARERAHPTETSAETPTGESLPEGDVPDAHRGTGDSVLVLRITDAVDGTPAGSEIRLWRLGVPEDDVFTAGDHVQAGGKVARTDGLRLEKLPEGRYRLQVLDAAKTADDPPEFQIGPGENLHTASVEFPRRHPMRLVLVDRWGVPWTGKAKRFHGGHSSSWHGPGAPGWASPRSLHDATGLETSIGIGGGSGSAIGTRDGFPVEVTDGASDLGLLTASRRRRSEQTTWTYRFGEGMSDVRVRVSSEDAGRGDYVALVVPITEVAGHVWLPDGRRALEAGASVSATCGAILFTDAHPATRWQDAKIEVKVTLGTCEPLSYTWTVRDPTPDAITMQRTAEAD